MTDRYEYLRLDANRIGLMRQMLSMLGHAFEDPRTYTASQPDDRYLREMLAGDAFIAIVATHGTEVVGGLAAYVLPKFEQARREIYIYDLAVAESHRRRGVATGLIRLLQRTARAIGAYVIFVQADPVDGPAVALYTKLGVREDVIHFDIPIEPMPPAP